VLPHPLYSLDLSPCDFFSVFMTEKRAKRTVTWEYRGYSSGCDDGAHRHSERGIHQLLSGLAETLATVYWLRRELLRRGEEALVVRLNFVFFTDSVSELYGQRMYIFVQHWWYIFSTMLWEHLILQKYSYFLISQNFLILHWNYIDVKIIFRVQAGWGVSVCCPSGLLCAYPHRSKTEGLPQDMSVFITGGSWTLPGHALLYSGLMLAG